ncbi:hypothetical protein BE11_15860 [Sorangium cellulosum]|nr:hypothetical protein BE11_15860 [Sorangium cellulosum]
MATSVTRRGLAPPRSRAVISATSEQSPPWSGRMSMAASQSASPCRATRKAATAARSRASRVIHHLPDPTMHRGQLTFHAAHPF